MNIEQARFNMIEQQIRPWNVLDTAVLELLAHTKREDFVPAAHRALAFADIELPLQADAQAVAQGRCMLAPKVEARMLQDLALRPTDSVLEIGTGSGYTAACLSRLARQVVSIEIHNDLAESARSRIGAAGIRNCQVLGADALSFHPAQTFDAIAVTGAVAEVPEAFLRWLKPGGRMFVIRGLSPAMEAVLMTRQSADYVETSSLFETDLPYLKGAEPASQFKF